MVNPKNNSTIWYCKVKDSKISIVQENGLRCFADPVDNSGYRVPWVTVQADPNGANFEVDLEEIEEKDTAWSFTNKDTLRVFCDIKKARLISN